MAIRRITPDDLEPVAQLHNKAFVGVDDPPSKRLIEYFRALFIDRPRADEPDFKSMLYEDGGKVVGFLGMLPSTWIWNGQEITAVTSTQYMVDPAHRTPLPSIELIREMFSGPQEFTIADGANRTSQRLWEGLGGNISHLYNFYWIKQFTANKPESTDITETGLVARPVTVGDLAANSQKVLSHLEPRPAHQKDEIEWTMEQAAEKKRYGQFRIIGLSDKNDDRIVGWFAYYDNPGDLSRVMQIAASKGSEDRLIRSMLDYIQASGATAVSGRLEPTLIDSMSKAGITFNRGFDGGAKHTLIHSKSQSIVDSILRGDGYLSRLEGEGWLNFVEQA